MEMLQSLKSKRKINEISFFIWELHIFREIDCFFTLVDVDENNHRFMFARKIYFSAWNRFELYFHCIWNIVQY